MTTRLPDSPLPDLRTVELTDRSVPALQRLFDLEADYFRAIQGAPAAPDEAWQEIHGEIPPDWGFTKKWLLGYLDEAGQLAAMAHVVSDLLAPGVWHVALFMIERARQGTGQAQRLQAGLEEWAHANGATWMRLGVVLGNVRAERFWAAQGFVEARRHEGVAVGIGVRTVCTLVKPLAGGTLPEYLQRVARDRPGPD